MVAPYQSAGTPGTRFVLAAVSESGAAQAAITLVGGTLDRRIALDEVANACVGLDATLILDVAGGEDAAVHDAVAATTVAAAAHQVPLIIAMTLAQVDVVFDAVRDGAPVLLCDPDQAQWITALLTAGALPGGGSGVRDPGDEAHRLARLRAEVARIAEALARLGDAAEPSAAADRRPGFDGPPVDAEVSAAEVRDVIRARRLRDRFFGEGLFEDPAWDMLLDLFAAGLERTQVSVSSLCIAAAVAPTTALRWIGRLTEAGLLDRAADPADRRRAFVTLSPRADAAMHRYVAGVRAAGLPLV
jgi:hypothetical protein